MGTAARDRQWAEKYPDLGTGPLSTEPYVSEEHFERERDRVFGRTWLNVGRVEDLPETGGYFARDIPAVGASVLIVRGPDGKVRGFHNVCSHRGTRMVQDDGKARRGTKILCPYHHWLYDATGDLINVPDEENFFDLDKTCHGLSPVRTDVRQGFIFVNLAADPPETLANYLGEIMEPLDGIFRRSCLSGWCLPFPRHRRGPRKARPSRSGRAATRGFRSASAGSPTTFAMSTVSRTGEIRARPGATPPPSSSRRLTRSRVSATTISIGLCRRSRRSIVPAHVVPSADAASA